MKVIKVDDNMLGRRLDRVIQKRHPNVPMSMIFKLIRKKSIRVNGKRATPNYLLAADDEIQLPVFSVAARAEKPEYRAAYKLDVLFEDEAIIVIDKPSGLASQGGSNVRHNAISELEAHLNASVYPVHRLDQGTSGCMLFAKNALAARKMAEKFHDRLVKKTYLAGVDGQVGLKLPLTIDHQYFVHNGMNDPFDIEAKTTLMACEVFEHVSLLTVLPQTGRKHQIRIHLAELSMPIIGDNQYGQNKHKRQRLMLHAESIAFDLGDKPLVIQSRLSTDFINQLKGLDKIK